MKYRPILLVSIIATLSAILSAQTTSISELQWRSYQPWNEEFSFRSPTTLKVAGESNSKSSRKYLGSINGVYLYVFSDPLKKLKYFPIVKEFVKQSSEESFEIPEGVFTKKEIEFTDSFGYYNRILICKSDTTLYVFQSVSEAKENIIGSRFISSISFDRTNTATPDTVSSSPSDAESPAGSPVNKSQPSNPNQDAGAGRGGGFGSGSGSGIGNGTMPKVTGSTTPISPTLGQTSGLKILSKPRPPYTSLARFYEITGTVRTRVTFLASGEIGSVQPISRLPFGLVENAVKAAKSIKFEPAYRDGKPVSVAKQVEYSFLIY